MWDINNWYFCLSFKHSYSAIVLPVSMIIALLWFCNKKTRITTVSCLNIVWQRSTEAYRLFTFSESPAVLYFHSGLQYLFNCEYVKVCGKLETLLCIISSKYQYSLSFFCIVKNCKILQSKDELFSEMRLLCTHCL